MLKRTAQGPQGSKESENEFGMSGTPDDKPQRATAAQLASRKIKEIRKRPRGTTPTGGTGESTGAFAQLSSAPAFPAPGFAAPTNQSVGFSFGQGQSQSFPGASAPPSQATQSNPTPFSFGGNSSTSFNFSSGIGSSANNPFANNPFSNPAPPQPTSITQPVGFGGFGSQAPSQPAFSFGAPQSATQPSGTSVGTGLFGQPPAANASGNSLAESMQTSPDAKPKQLFAPPSSPPSKNIFGLGVASNMFAPKPAASASNPFGGISLPPAAEKPHTDKADGFVAQPNVTGTANPAENKPFAGLFGAKAQPASDQTLSKPFEAKPFSGLFGATSTAPKQAELSAAQNPFAPKPASEQASDKSTGAPQPSQGIFGAPPAATKAAESASTTTAPPSLFTPKPVGEQASENKPDGFAAKSSFPSQTISASPVQAAGNQPFGSLSGAKAQPASDQTLSKPFEANPFKGLFGATSTASKQADLSAAPNPFAPKPASEQALDKSTGGLQQSQGIFGAQPAAEQAATHTATTSLFTPKPAAEEASDNPSKASQSFFGALSATPGAAEPVTKPTATSGLFAPKPATEQPATTFADSLGGKTTTPESIQAKVSTATQSDLASAHKPEAPGIPKLTIPPGTSKEVAEEAELLWKVRGLDKLFQQRVTEYQSGGNSLDDLIMFYIRVRNGLGVPLKGSAETKSEKSTGQAVHVDGVNGSSTSSIFAKSFSAPSPSPQPVAASSAPADLFAVSKPNGSATLMATPSSPAPKPAGNMFAQSAPKPSQSASVAPVPAIAPPKFGNSGGAVDFMAQFKQKAEKTMAEEKAKRKAEDFDSDDDDEEEWERRDAEKQREKRAQLEAGAGKPKKSVFRNGKFEWVDADEAAPAASEGSASKATDKPAEKSVASTLSVPAGNGASNAPSPASSIGSIFDTGSRPLPPSENIFGRLTPKPSEADKESDESDDEDKPHSSKRAAEQDASTDDEPKSKRGKTFATDAAEDEAHSPKRAAEEESTDDDFASALRNSKRTKVSETADAAKSSLNAPLPAPTAAASRSLFDRIQAPAPTPQNEASAPTSDLFGRVSSPFTPSLKETSTSSLFARAQSPAAAAGKETSSSTSNLFSTSFGQNSSFGHSISFGQSSATPSADKTWKPSTPIKFSTDSTPAAASAPESTVASTQPSSAIDSGEATPDEENAPGEVFDLTKANAGEEEETVVFECRARAFMLTTGWTSKGIGIVRLLKHPETGRARIVLRADPGGNVILNTFLKKELDYARKSNSIQFMVPQADKEQPEHWIVRVNAQSIDGLYNKIQGIKN